MKPNSFVRLEEYSFQSWGSELRVVTQAHQHVVQMRLYFPFHSPQTASKARRSCNSGNVMYRLISEHLHEWTTEEWMHRWSWLPWTVQWMKGGMSERQVIRALVFQSSCSVLHELTHRRIGCLSSLRTLCRKLYSAEEQKPALPMSCIYTHLCYCIMLLYA